MEIEVRRGSEKDIDSTNIVVTFKSGEHTKKVYGHINNRTNWVHLTPTNFKQQKELIHWGVELDEVEIKIENREIELN